LQEFRDSEKFIVIFEELLEVVVYLDADLVLDLDVEVDFDWLFWSLYDYLGHACPRRGEQREQESERSERGYA